MIVKAHYSPTPRPTYGELVGKVISSSRLDGPSQSAYLIAQVNQDTVSLISLEYPERSIKPTPASMVLGTGYVVRENATLILDPK